MRHLKAFISGCSGPQLDCREFAFFRNEVPCGLILFKRNCETPEQVRHLCASFREAVEDEDALVLIDQEGGRVQRMGPPVWRAFPPAHAFAALYEKDTDVGLNAARSCARLIAEDLRAAGISVNCAPVIDIPAPGAHDIIGDRAYGTDTETVTALGRAVASGYLDGGILPVIKHIPGHGRALADSHVSLPTIACSHAELSAADFVPFRLLADLPIAMTAHILIPDIDRSAPVSASGIAVSHIIREEIGFDGLLLCDDLGMGALSGAMQDRARGVIGAGCDVALQCSGDFDEMQDVAAAVPPLAGDALRRFEAAVMRRTAPAAFDLAHAEALLAKAAALA